jgi:hypothetical protein
MKKRIIAIALCAAVSLNGCHEKFLEEDAYSFLTPANFYTNARDAQAAVNAVYKSLYNSNGDYYGYNLLSLNEIATETTTSTLWSPADEHGRLDIWDPRVGDLPGLYTATFVIINQANAVLDNVPRIAMDETLKNRILGEAYFLRALAYFNGVRVYGDLPLLLSETKALENLQVSNAPAAQIYGQIIEDLTFAKENLPSAKTYAAADRGRAGRSAAKTLLAKVYLTRGSEPGLAQGGDYQEAVNLLREVIADGDHNLEESFAKVFDIANENNPEVIFDIQLTRVPGLGGRFTTQIATGSTRDTYSPSFATMNVEQAFYNSYAPGDQRLDATFHNTVTLLSNGNVVRYDPANPRAGGFPQDTPGFRKFVDFDRTARLNAEEPNFIVLRYADVLLMLAEGINQVNNGPTAEAYDLVNRIRRRAFGKSLAAPDAAVDLPAGLDYNGFREALLTERRKELVMEGHGWFDGMRFYDIFLDRVAAASAGGAPNQAFRPKAEISRARISDPKYRHLPIPATAIERNPNLAQPAGW